jgi:hypothetical protein
MSTSVYTGLNPFNFIRQLYADLLSESLCALIQGFGSDVHERLYSKNWIKQLHTLPVLHFNRCLTTEYSQTTALFNGNFYTDKQICVP